MPMVCKKTKMVMKRSPKRALDLSIPPFCSKFCHESHGTNGFASYKTQNPGYSKQNVPNRTPELGKNSKKTVKNRIKISISISISISSSSSGGGGVLLGSATPTPTYDGPGTGIQKCL